MNKREFGKAGEELVAEYFRQNGYRILCRNYWCKSGEIDIVMQENDCVHFVEVKTRTSQYYGVPSESVTWRKVGSMKAAAESYMKSVAGMPGLGRKMQFDVVEVQLKHLQNI